MDNFVEVLKKNGKKFFVFNKTKTETSLENCRKIVLKIKKNFRKTKFPTNLSCFRTVGDPRNLQEIVRLDTIWEQLAKG